MIESESIIKESCPASKESGLIIVESPSISANSGLIIVESGIIIVESESTNSVVSTCAISGITSGMAISFI